ncbi:hypothetical protein DICPUDRAFT_155939 [Dictyostelium purpureum]|uniref:Ubiquitin-like protease family profile domain-containing protein n=1 Tax=Dictyostelium purpureum TaxID=5786 RepID=F0ZVA1_DICPU|nr:uncharacterized protein DICPUDRAFT_155939 [Dictyostelium purpureum]EGC32140.1 hypothetical protein DICPUDRAFT_155939 [Dictyostelium purpureum]|eukprot:XP_003291349.1 hypothetical protein DICPUDRAFT_155939 [Dictyostelium purpureum]
MDFLQEQMKNIDANPVIQTTRATPRYIATGNSTGTSSRESLNIPISKEDGISKEKPLIKAQLQQTPQDDIMELKENSFEEDNGNKKGFMIRKSSFPNTNIKLPSSTSSSSFSIFHSMKDNNYQTPSVLPSHTMYTDEEYEEFSEECREPFFTIPYTSSKRDAFKNDKEGEIRFFNCGIKYQSQNIEDFILYPNIRDLSIFQGKKIQFVSTEMFRKSLSTQAKGKGKKSDLTSEFEIKESMTFSQWKSKLNEFGIEIQLKDGSKDAKQQYEKLKEMDKTKFEYPTSSLSTSASTSLSASASTSLSASTSTSSSLKTTSERFSKPLSRTSGLIAYGRRGGEKLPESILNVSPIPKKKRMLFTNKINPEEGYEDVRKWTGKEDIFQKDFVFVPINYAAHWSLMIICYPGRVKEYKENDKKRPCMIYLDSLFRRCVNFQENLRKYLTLEWKNKKYKDGNNGFEEVEFNSTNYPLRVPHVPLQNNSYDCGVFLLHYLELFCKNPITDFNKPLELPNWFKVSEITKKRKELKRLIYKLRKEQNPDAATLEEEETYEIVYKSESIPFPLDTSIDSSIEIIDDPDEITTTVYSSDLNVKDNTKNIKSKEKEIIQKEITNVKDDIKEKDVDTEKEKEEKITKKEKNKVRGEETNQNHETIKTELDKLESNQNNFKDDKENDQIEAQDLEEEEEIESTPTTLLTKEIELKKEKLKLTEKEKEKNQPKSSSKSIDRKPLNSLHLSISSESESENEISIKRNKTNSSSKKTLELKSSKKKRKGKESQSESEDEEPEKEKRAIKLPRNKNKKVKVKSSDEEPRKHQKKQSSSEDEISEASENEKFLPPSVTLQKNKFGTTLKYSKCIGGIESDEVSFELDN